MYEKTEETSSKKYELNPALFEALSQVMEQASEATRTLAPILQSIGEKCSRVIESISPFFLQYQEYLERDNISVPFVKCGLWLAPSMTPALVKSVLDKYEQGNKRAVLAIIEGFYRSNNFENLRNTVNRWSHYEFFTPRMQIFYDSLDAHIAKKWTLTIPTLLPHIEGIAGEILLANGLPLKNDSYVVDNGYKTYPSYLYSNMAVSEVTPTMDVIINTLLNYLEGTLYAYTDFKEYPKVRRLPKLNRHAILHGYQVNYATRLNSLRCFLALDSLSMLKGNMPKIV